MKGLAAEGSCENGRFRTVDTATSLPRKKLLRNFVAFL